MSAYAMRTGRERGASGDTECDRLGSKRVARAHECKDARAAALPSALTTTCYARPPVSALRRQSSRRKQMERASDGLNRQGGAYLTGRAALEAVHLYSFERSRSPRDRS